VAQEVEFNDESLDNAYMIYASPICLKHPLCWTFLYWIVLLCLPTKNTRSNGQIIHTWLKSHRC